MTHVFRFMWALIRKGRCFHYNFVTLLEYANITDQMQIFY